MGSYSKFLYHSGVLYGPTTVLAAVSPERGPSPGGNDFIFTGSGFDPRQWDDDWIDLLLDPTLWTDISAGSGSVATGPLHLEMVTGAVVGSVAGVESITTWLQTQGEIRVILPPITTYPTDEVKVIAFSFYVDANNYAEMYIEQGISSGTLQLRCEVYRNGALVDELIKPVPWTIGLSVLKILRWNEAIYFYANGSLIYLSHQFPLASNGKFRIFSTNAATTYNLQGLRVEWFYFRPYAVFQNQPVHDTVIVSGSRMRGLVPASMDARRQAAAYEGFVDTHVVGNGTVTLSDSYEYYYLDALKVIDSVQTETRLSIIDDAQLLTPAGSRKGLGV